MNSAPLFFSLSLDLPPVISYAERDRRSTSNETRIHNVTYWGLDFYHCRGQIEFLDYGKTVQFRPGDVGITGPNEAIRVTDYSDRDSLYFSFNVVDSEMNKFLLPTILNLGERFLPLQNMGMDVIRAWKVQPKRAQALLWTILWEIVRHHDRTNDQAKKCPRCIREAAEIIELELGGELSLTQLAERVNLSPSRLSRLFHEHMGVTLVKYIRKQRMDRACFFLEHTNMTVKEIAYRVGVVDVHVFNKSFKKEMARSPSAYRAEKT